jgi:serine/threonine-protein kinase
MSIAFNDATELNSNEWMVREQILRRFEDAWRRGPRPRLEDYLPAAGPDRPAVLLELVHTDLEYRLKDGEPARVEEYLARFPELKNDPEAELELIKAELDLRRRPEPALALDEFLARFPQYQPELLSMRTRSHHPKATLPLRRTCPQCHAPFEVPRDESPEAAACPSCGASIRLDRGFFVPWTPGQSRLGKYELLEEVGRGLFGVVYRARDTELDRAVALKVPRAGRLATAEEMDRFLREARSAAQLEHPHIVSVHDAGRAGETCYLACAFVPGMTLARRMAAGRLPFREVAALVARGRGLASCPPPGRGSPRRQAREHPPRPAGGAAPDRLRPGQAGRRGDHADPRRGDVGDPRVHVARAGTRRGAPGRRP